MTDLLHVLPDFDTASYSHILPSLERALIVCNDILTLDPLDVAKRANVPSAEVRRLKEDVNGHLQSQLKLCHSVGFLTGDWAQISTLDPDLDAVLGGGFPAGYLSEITGESAAGKTQFLLSLCLAVQLPAPHGLKRSALYITTEASLQTSRLQQIMSSNALLNNIPAGSKPSLARIHSIKCPDLESQDHILTYQVPVAVARHDIGLIIIDSIAANFRAEFDSAPQSDDKRRAAFTARTNQILKLGAHLRSLAQKHNLAVVVANQVLDRFSTANDFSNTSQVPPSQSQSQSSTQPSRTPSSTLPPSLLPQEQVILTPSPLRNEHQQRFTTGWGSLSPSILSSLSLDPSVPWSELQHLQSHSCHPKTPSLGLAWSAQLAARIVLLRSPVYKRHDYRLGVQEKDVARWRRGLAVVFAPWARESAAIGREFEIWEGGVRGVTPEEEEGEA